tara:strand:+ start:2441 stop:3340 length:900 start_codon:yes stop_codon:yes gene_type:complete
MIKDQLSWEEFLKNSPKNKKINKIEPFNRLIAHSKNFFIISGYGAFTKGYLVVITKDYLPSFGLMESKDLYELNFIIKICQKSIEDEYNRKTVMFEHGMCACVGGLDRAHLHLMSISVNSDNNSLKTAIERSLFNRKAGIKSISLKGHKLQNIHDINQLYDEAIKDEKNYQIEGKLLKLRDIKNLKNEDWPIITYNHISKGGHYVFFRSDNDDSSFLTTNNFQTQLGREIVYNNELEVDENFKKEMVKLNKNEFVNTWQWQNFMFEENIIETIEKSKKNLKNFENLYNDKYKEFELKVL